MATKLHCDICNAEHKFYSTFTEVRIASGDPQLADTRMDICPSCKRKLNKYIKSIKKEEKNGY